MVSVTSFHWGMPTNDPRAFGLKNNTIHRWPEAAYSSATIEFCYLHRLGTSTCFVGFDCWSTWGIILYLQRHGVNRCWSWINIDCCSCIVQLRWMGLSGWQSGRSVLLQLPWRSWALRISSSQSALTWTSSAWKLPSTLWSGASLYAGLFFPWTAWGFGINFGVDNHHFFFVF